MKYKINKNLRVIYHGEVNLNEPLEYNPNVIKYTIMTQGYEEYCDWGIKEIIEHYRHKLNGFASKPVKLKILFKLKDEELLDLLFQTRSENPVRRSTMYIGTSVKRLAMGKVS